jgi:hypothetical protein
MIFLFVEDENCVNQKDGLEWDINYGVINV